MNISGDRFYRRMGPFISLMDLRKERMFLNIPAGNRCWNVAADLGRRIVFQKAMRKRVEQSSQRKKENQRQDQGPIP